MESGASRGLGEGSKGFNKGGLELAGDSHSWPEKSPENSLETCKIKNLGYLPRRQRASSGTFGQRRGSPSVSSSI